MKRITGLGLLLLMGNATIASAAVDEWALKRSEQRQTPPVVIAGSMKSIESYTGDTTGGAQWDRAFADGTCCSGLGPVTYVTQDFHVLADDTCSIGSVQDGFDGYLFVYQAPFDPADQTANFVAGDDDGNGGIGTSDIEGVGLTTGTTYTVVTTGFANGDEGTFTNTISCPTADVVLGEVPPPDYAVGGTLSGLASGNSVVLRNSHAPPAKVAAGDDDLELTSNGSFTFATRLNEGDTFSVDVLTQPSSPNQVCTVTSGASKAVNGTIGSADVDFIQVDCVTNTYSVGGSVSGLVGSGLQLQINGGETLAISSNGAFAFPTALDDGSAYAVTVAIQPSEPEQLCDLSGEGGSLAGADVTTVVVTCVTTITPPDAPQNVQFTTSGRSVTVTWSAPADDGGSPITSYSVIPTPSGPGCIVEGNPPPTSCTLNNLQPGTYTFQVVAANAVGAGAAAAAAGGSVTVTPLIIPSLSMIGLIVLMLAAAGLAVPALIRRG